MTMERATLEINPPRDRLKIIYFILLLHGIGTLMPWNMFINALSVSLFVEHFSDFSVRIDFINLLLGKIHLFCSTLNINSVQITRVLKRHTAANF